MHRMQFVQVAHCELFKAFLGFFFYQYSEVLFCVLSLFYLSLEYFLELVNFIECFRVALLVTLALLQF